MAGRGLIVKHEPITENLTQTEDCYLTLKPEAIPFISCPCEWSFDMLKDAAILTLQLLKESIKYGLVLKDATPYNIQFIGSSPVFIDSLSFEKYNEKEPWIAYRQFCESFLSPLLLSHYTQQSLQQLMLAYPEGIPLAVTKSLLPWRSKLSLHCYLHIHLHANINKSRATEKGKIRFTKQKLINLTDSLEKLVQKTFLRPHRTAWSAYYDEASKRNDYLASKKEIIISWLNEIANIRTAADLGSNDGQFSKLLAEKNISIVSTDFDPECINRLYKELKLANSKRILPLIIDLANPTPAIGVNNQERNSFTDRLNTDIVLALALVHHLAIGRNMPFEYIAQLLTKVSRQLIIEFVPKEDEKVRLMLSARKDIFSHYYIDEFEKAFGRYFSIEKKQTIASSGRTLYLMKRNEDIAD